MAELVEFDAVDDFLRALALEVVPERKLRKALEGHYNGTAPLHARVWRWVKGVAREVKEISEVVRGEGSGRD